MLGAHIGGQLILDKGTVLRNASGPALYADDVRVDQMMVLRGKFAGSDADGVVRLSGGHIGSQLNASGATLTNEERGPALYADGLRVDQGLYLRGFVASGASGDAAVRLVGADIGGQLDLSRAKLTNEASGPALAADGLRVTRGLYLRGFTAIGSGELGAVRLPGAHIGGQLDATDAWLTNTSGAALHADSLHVDENLLLRGAFVAVGSGELGAVRLPGAHIGGQLDAAGAVLSNTSGPALIADALQVGQHLFLRRGFAAIGAGELGAVRLPNAHIGGQLAVDPSAIKDPGLNPDTLMVDGLEYAGLPAKVTVDEWLDVLKHQTTKYTPQPYRQLAAATQAAGWDRETRKILIAQRRDQLGTTAITDRTERAWAKLTGVVLGYGYQPWRALLFLLGVVAVAIALTLGLGSHGGLAHPRGSASPGSACTTVEQIGVALDLSLPLIKTGARDACNTTTTTAGDIITISGWTLQLAAWALATLFIAGFTSAVRKT
ncbi:hypothetical protein AB0E63_42805 [Kribbella sp. NPDC026596]|uniref:hypothetical protein n=1 Tax=Kribbella sp. NPDC026596 TaxID=3155122 RepID=UPI0033CA7BFF